MTAGTAATTATAGAAAETLRRRLEIRGTVQGVGFRPFLYRLARTHGLAGFARNGPAGVLVEIEGPAPRLQAFIEAVRTRPPPRADVRGVSVRAIPARGDRDFVLRDSRAGGAAGTGVLPDLATCDTCLGEIRDPADRRYRYPFTNCTDCGPRYSILHALPYDRARTAMAGFALCPACAAEYADPSSRRFHAEANACPDCGPQLALAAAGGGILARRDAALREAAAIVQAGGIVAVKGLGGYQLLADARNSAAVDRLRARKRRPDKPFALMLPGLDAARALCRVGPREEALLTGPERPIVLLRRRGGAAVAAGVAPDGNPRLGIMLPYTPLHHLLLEELGFAVVATSGNRSEEPIAIDNDEALARLGGIADYFLVHDRPVVRAVDDSVARLLLGRAQILRRARGYAPASVAAAAAPGVLALGGHLKATLALTGKDGIILGPHIGDLDGPRARDAHAAAATDLPRLHATLPRVLACDLHPDYPGTRKAEQLAGELHLPLVRVQHHLAHVAAGMAEHALAPPLLGVAWDGTGYGPDGTVWGGEFLLVTAGGWRRAAHLRPFRLPGGEAAVREPRRAAFGVLYEIFGEELADRHDLLPGAGLDRAARGTLAAMLRKAVNAPLTTSAGRLFDAAAALLGLSQVASYEGQAACLLEWAAGASAAAAGYEFPLIQPAGAGPVVIDWAPAVRDMLADRAAGVPAADSAAAFHHGLAAAMGAVAAQVDAPAVLLTGGCFQNALLTGLGVAALRRTGRRVYWHEKIPPGDGGLAAGQAAWAARQVRGEAPCA